MPMSLAFASSHSHGHGNSCSSSNNFAFAASGGCCAFAANSCNDHHAHTISRRPSTSHFRKQLKEREEKIDEIKKRIKSLTEQKDALEKEVDTLLTEGSRKKFYVVEEAPSRSRRYAYSVESELWS
ncbi:hypothetical protein EJ08DRAFT_653105 [Tothia fuscella]|uniref:Uncharacterized protein n=1 Tax=Tothia fuscella TaxID=1048955 RepID=A0A9P4NI98_9PEZI|nr:hypothetical protein EJ08DRAFT_653105 [Tothia fuscella]